jgi:hypothetical protein
MKNVIRVNKFLLAFIALIAVLVSCVKKDDYYKKAGDETNRKQTVQITGASDIIVYARDVNPTIDTFEVIDLRRYPNSNAELNTPLTVKLTPSASAVNDYNTANGTSYVLLPSSDYTILGDLNNITFAPGEAIKEIKIRLDKTNMDLSQQYALAFTVSDVGANAVINKSLSTAVYSIGVKNKYDGHYQVTGSMVDLTSGALTGAYPWDVYLVTSGPNTVYIYDNYWGGDVHGILSSGSPSYYGSFGVQINFDPSGNGVINSVTNTWGQPASNTRAAQLDPSGINKWDPATKKMDIKYFMLQPSVVPAPPNIRTTFDEHFKYLGPR